MLLGSWGAMQVCFEFSAFLFCHPGSSCTHLLVMQLPPGFLFGDSTSSACGLFVTSFSPLPYCATRCPYCSQAKNLQATAGVHVGSLSLSLSLSHTHTHTHTHRPPSLQGESFVLMAAFSLFLLNFNLLRVLWYMEVLLCSSSLTSPLSYSVSILDLCLLSLFLPAATHTHTH